jgi:cold shock CspA family protein
MRVQGRLTEWNDSRGFGFITPLAGGSRVFAHITEFPAGDRRPLVNDLLTYVVSSDERGRPRAVQVLHLTPVGPAASKQQHTPSLSGRSRRLASPQLILILALALVAALALMIPAMSPSHSRGPASVTQPAASSDPTIATAFRNQQSGIQVVGRGTVVKVLPDDTSGDRHQRFIIELASGQTLLITHNIDIAPRIPSMTQGAGVAFSGVYEWNAEGGVVHWTHHDPSGQHAPGWLDLDGVRYQ